MTPRYGRRAGQQAAEEPPEVRLLLPGPRPHRRPRRREVQQRLRPQLPLPPLRHGPAWPSPAGGRRRPPHRGPCGRPRPRVPAACATPRALFVCRSASPALSASRRSPGTRPAPSGPARTRSAAAPGGRRTSSSFTGLRSYAPRSAGPRPLRLGACFRVASAEFEADGGGGGCRLLLCPCQSAGCRVRPG